MRLLVLGGTVFVGRHIVDAALANGHEVTLFSRGKHGADLFAEIERIRGDRRTDLSRLTGRSWDAVIDTSGYHPETVRASAQMLVDHASHYTFISSASVYSDHSRPGLAEDSPVAATWERAASPQDPAAYGPLKAACESEVESAFPGRSAIVRPGLLVGPYDPTDRFGYWPARMARGGNVLAPGPRDAPIQVIDARDHARFVVDLTEQTVCGTFNATSPPGEVTIGDVISACSTADSRATVVWVQSAFLSEYGVRPWTEMPLWPGDDPSLAGTMSISTTRAEARGLRCRPLKRTAADTLAWELGRGALDPRGGQLTALREHMLLLIADEEGRAYPPE